MFHHPRYRLPVSLVLALSILVFVRYTSSAPMMTLTVLNANDSGAGSLRQAILDANATPGADTIAFNIGAGGLQTISPISQLPPLTDTVTIDGTTQPGFTTKPIIELSGTSAGSATGLLVNANNCTIKGLIVNRFSGGGIAVNGNSNIIEDNFIGIDSNGTAAAPVSFSGVFVSGTSGGGLNNIVRRNVIATNGHQAIALQAANGTIVQGNYLGTDFTGSVALGGEGIFVFRGASNNLIGGTTAAERNVIAGTIHFGILVNTFEGGGATGNLIQGNYFGLNATGTTPIPIDGSAIYLDGVSGNTVGGTASGAGNVISANNGSGITIGPGSSGNFVQGNLIGTNPAGTAALPNNGGVTINDAANNVIGGTTAGRNVISGNNGENVSINGINATGNTVAGNYIGTDVSGTAALGGSGVGLHNSANNNTVGGTDASARNVISGNLTGHGIALGGNSANPAFNVATNNRIQGNYIGPNAAGTAVIGNIFSGVFLQGAGVTGNTVGGTAAGTGNVISGNAHQAVGIVEGAANNLVQGNFIGTDAAGNNAVGGNGILISASNNNLIGGTSAGARNVISGNTNAINISANSTGNSVQGNFIGTNAVGTAPLPNSLAIILHSVSGNLIGGTASGAGNLIANNNSHGVTVESGQNNGVLSNSIFANTGLALGLLNGGNNNQAAPTLNSVNSSGGFTSVQGTLNSTANTTFTLQFFGNDACDSSGSGEGQIFLGSGSVLTGANGLGTFSSTLIANLNATQVVTATATDPNNNTSQYSVCRTVGTSSFSISGRVLDSSGNAIGGVSVSVNGATTVNTDAGGNYTFANLTSGGNYIVGPSSSSYLFSPTSHTFNGLSTDRIANFVGTQTEVTISGRVTDASNVGIGGVTLALTQNGLSAGTVSTNAQGDYTFSNVEAMENYVVTPQGSFTPSSQSFNRLTVNAVANFTGTPSIPSQCNTVSFSRTDFAAGVGPESVAIGDFNNDGKSDLAVANFISSNVSILLGTGTGSFETATNFPVGTNPVSVAIADFNGDGRSDLAVVNINSNNLSILLGTGTGSFGVATNFAVGSGPEVVGIGNFNNDGNTDLVVANAGSNNVSILLGTGTGTFGAATNFTAGGTPISLAVGDFNGDGMSDLAVANGSTNDVSILVGTGTGSFGAATNFPAGTEPQSVAIGDFNSDGKGDLVVTNDSSANVSILFGTGTGSFSVATNFNVGSTSVSVTIGDINGDGKSDLAVATIASAVSILLGTGTGSFGVATNFPVGASRISVGIGDVNGDGKNDLAVANFNTNNISILLNDGASCNTQTSLTISGRLADANNPLPDVAVTLSGPVTRVTQTNASGDYAFTNLVPGGNYAVTVQSPQYVFAPSRMDFLNLSSTQTVNFTAAPVVVPSSLPPPNDDFTSSTRDPNKWNLGTLSLPPNAFDPLVNVAQINGQLLITPLAQVSGLHYNGYVSANSFDLRGGSVSVELVEAATGGADSIFAIGTDSDNFYRFMVRTAGPGVTPVPSVRGRDGIERPLDVTVAQLVFQVNVGGQLTSLSIPYDPVAHRFMRFRHDAPANAIVFETSPNNIDFVERHRVTLTRSVSALTAELSAGTSSPTNPGVTRFDNFGLVTSTFQFSASNYTVDEGGGSILITVTRAGSTAGTATVDFSTSDGTALQSSDYILATGRLTFAPGETSKTFQVLIIDNAQAEGNQNLNLLLQEPSASGLNTPGRAVLTINDNDTAVATVNPLETPTFFVTEHYFDFLNRLPDQSGLDFWVNQITGCGTDTQCIEIKRINVSAAYFLSIEYQETGFLVHRFYNLALNRANGLPRYLEFFRDSRIVGNGVVIGAPGADELLEANKVAYSNEFVARAEFLGLYPLTLTAAQYVDALYSHAGITPSPAERQAAIDEFNTPAGARGRVLRRVADNSTLRAREFNRAFVLAQYFGYLRRNPDDAPDNNLDGYNFWLGKLNQFNGNFVNAEMVKAFITSGEYRHRFGP